MFSAITGSKIVILGGINYHSFLPADLLVLETDQGYAGELAKKEEQRVSKLRPASPYSPGLSSI